MFLVASRNLPDPNFSETVVLLAVFGDEGAMGLVVNRRSDVPLGRLLSGMKGATDRSDLAHVGGRVAPTGVVALVRSRSPVTDGRHIFGDVHLLTTRPPLEAMLAAGAKPNAFRVYLGYAGWSPSQLETEVALGSWHVFPADVDVVFDPDPETTWLRQIRRTESRMARAIDAVSLLSSPRPR
jgi:putative transcriptional regulator